MKTIYFYFVFYLSTLILFTSCQHYYYLPNVQNVPLLKEANECHVSGTIGTGEYIKGYEGQISYALTSNVGMMSSYMYATSSEGKGNYYDFGMGYFKPIGKKVLFEFYGGMGLSSQQHQYSGSYGYRNNLSFAVMASEERFNKLFIQPAIAISTSAFDLAFSCRLAQLKFTSINVRDVDGKEKNLTDWDGLTIGDPIYLFEPALTIRGGWQYVKMQSQLLISSEFNGSHPFEKFNYSIGIYFSFADRFLKKQHSK